MLNLRKQAVKTMDDVSVASRKIAETADWGSLALIAVAGVAVIAVMVALVALERASNER